MNKKKIEPYKILGIKENIKIGYTSEIAKPYTEGIRKCKSLEDLKSFLSKWKELASDAIEVVNDITFSWSEYQKGEKLERAGKYSGDEWTAKYGAIIIPAKILKIGLLAAQFGVPEGTAYIRLTEIGAV